MAKSGMIEIFSENMHDIMLFIQKYLDQISEINIYIPYPYRQ